MKDLRKNRGFVDNNGVDARKNNQYGDNDNSNIISSDVKFENDAIDPGFETDRNKIESDAVDVRPKTLKEASNSLNSENSDALNYKNDRSNGSFNPKNI